MLIFFNMIKPLLFFIILNSDMLIHIIKKKLKFMIKKLFFLLSLLFLITTVAFSQVTTSSLTGKVLTDKNEPLPGATIVAVHQPSGTQYGTVSNNEGRFNIEGMRSGGPYSVEVTFVGYSTEKFSTLTLYLGESYSLNVTLKESNVDVGEVVVLGSKPSAFGTQKTGASSNISNEAMTLMPSLNRSLSDYTKLSPFATGGGSYVGREAYNTNITVDGANFNNNFGLSSSNMPGVSGEPISMDAIEEIQVAVAPFDVRQSNFTGAGVNAITKSGTNKFKGSAYTYFRNQDMNGNYIKDKKLNLTESSKEVYGFNLGGPIIKNKLFFFVSGEMEKSLTPGNELLAMDANRDPNDVNVNSRVNAADLQKFSGILKDKYGYETGKYESWGGDNENNNKLLAKIDWNISQNHKFTARYNYSKSDNVSRPSSSGDASPSILNGRHSRTGGMSFENSQYYNTSTLQSITGELNSKFGNLSNKALVAYTKYGQPRSTDSQVFPFIDIMAGDPAKGDVKMSAGYELFSYKNNVDNNTLILTDNLTYLLNNHTLTAGVSYEHEYFANSYLRQGSAYYRFKDLTAFENFTNGVGVGKPYSDTYNPINFAYTYPINGLTNPVAELSFGQLSSYIQDEWSPINNLKLTGGVRIDIPMYLDGAMDNPNVAKYAFRDGEKVDLGTWPESKILWSPRLGFNWDVKGDRSIKVRGGTGIFTGRIPFVWFTNQPSNSGMIQYRQVINQNGGAAQKAQLARLPLYNDASQLLTDPALADIFPQQNPEGGSIAAVDKNFKLPQVWRTSLGVDFKLPLDMALSLEGIYTKDINGIYFDNINLKPAESTITEGTNTRPYWSNNTNATKYYSLPYTDVIIMRNTNKGQGYTLATQLDLPKIAGFSGMIAYSKSWNEEVAGKNGSDPLSAWRYRQIRNSLNDQELGLSFNNTPSRIVANINYGIEYAKVFKTTVSVFYTGYSGSAYSYIYNGDVNKDGTSGHELMYIPRDNTELDFGVIDATTKKFVKSDAEAEAYFAFAAQDPYLSKHAGEYAERNAAHEPFYNRFDVRLLQDIKFKANKLQISADVINAANLLNSDWGINQYYTTNSPLNVVGRDATTGKVQVSMRKIGTDYVKTSFQDPSSVSATWGLQFGLRYFFN